MVIGCTEYLQYKFIFIILIPIRMMEKLLPWLWAFVTSSNLCFLSLLFDTITKMNLNFPTVRHWQTLWTQIRLQPSDQGPQCLPFCLHLLGPLFCCKMKLIKLNCQLNIKDTVGHMITVHECNRLTIIFLYIQPPYKTVTSIL